MESGSGLVVVVSLCAEGCGASFGGCLVWIGSVLREIWVFEWEVGIWGQCTSSGGSQGESGWLWVNEWQWLIDSGVIGFSGSWRIFWW
jgi:hypothetical protein